MISLSAFLPEMIETIKGHLADVLGIELADKIENQYRIFFRLSYYMDLMTQLWFAPKEIDDRAEIQEGFRIHFISILQQGMETSQRFKPQSLRSKTPWQRCNQKTMPVDLSFAIVALIR